MKSSAKPSTAAPSATPNTARLCVSRGPRTRYGTAIAMKMISPPIVGVPALAWCSCGPSSRICWPNSRSRRNSMNFGDRKTQISSDAVPAISTSPIRQRLRHDLEADAPRALDEQHVARLDQLAGQRRGLGGVGDRVRVAVEGVEHHGRARADGDEHIDPGGAGGLPHLAVQVGLAVAELEHVAEDRDAAA